jgi:hypothetical protein
LAEILDRPFAHHVIDADRTIQAFVLEAIREKLARHAVRLDRGPRVD